MLHPGNESRQPLLPGKKRTRPIPQSTLLGLALTAAVLMCLAVGIFTANDEEIDKLGNNGTGLEESRRAKWGVWSKRTAITATEMPVDPPVSTIPFVYFSKDGNNFTVLGFTFDGIGALKSTICPTIGAILSTMLAFAPLAAIRRAKELKSLTTNPAPYPAMFANATNWIAYAFIIKDAYVFIGNLPGMVMGLYYTISAFDVSTNKDHRRLVRRLVYGYAFAFPLMAALLAIFMKNDAMTQLVVAYFSMFFLIAFYAAPLVEIQSVLRERNASSLDARLAWCCLANSLMWFVYGLALQDLCVWFPNVIGIILALIQLGLKYWFPSVNLEDINVEEALVYRAGKEKKITVPRELAESAPFARHYVSSVILPVVKALKLPNSNNVVANIRQALNRKEVLNSVQKILEDGDDFKDSEIGSTWRGGSVLLEEDMESESIVKGFRQMISKELQMKPKAVVSGSKVSFCVTDANGIIYSCSRKFLEMTGYSLYEMCGVNCNRLQKDSNGISYTDPKAIESIREATKQGKEHHVVVYNYDKRGNPFWNLLHIYPLSTSIIGKVDRFIGIQEKISEEEAFKLGGKIVKNAKVPPTELTELKSE
mmetsp:Transcript_18406/g.45184  ORF Transcript_18406/g.45184 Transcript_18406/m.45184 type:complete len:595 (+) Transcript_18406:371-2155(+)|eukprot:CAMPEP_0114516534 /NCGR_PEP_ID=MMETSP0109-20121206/17382_1 /TAXON_ID=29199 /ORGANISM="Chlorarachnion reptans, Strain CCCM449" /LENGTH=594 /DNA_ID=CAMNT_0001696935 /DNA_START=349 /DNA_END=2133 /DNA_ORIENTATION=-